MLFGLSNGFHSVLVSLMLNVVCRVIVQKYARMLVYKIFVFNQKIEFKSIWIGVNLRARKMIQQFIYVI